MGSESKTSELKKYSIREVSMLTGVKPVTLRAWQRRYNLVSPRRTDTGHRMYLQQDIDRIMDIQRWLAQGIPIRKVGPLLDNGTASYPVESRVSPEAVILEACQPFLAAVADYQYGRAESLLIGVFQEYPLSIVENQFVAPVFDAIDQVKTHSRSLQHGLIQTLLSHRLTMLIEAENKASSRGKCLVVNLDSTGNVYAQLWTAHLAESGFFTILIDGAEDISGLVDHACLAGLSHLSFFANRALNSIQIRTISELIGHFKGEVTLSPMIRRLHSEAFSL